MGIARREPLTPRRKALTSRRAGPETAHRVSAGTACAETLVMSAKSIFKHLARGGLFLGLLVGTAHADVAGAWQSGGTGDAAAAVTQAAPRVNQTAKLGIVAPGVPAQTLSGNFDNRSSDAVHVGTVRVRIASVRKAPGAAAGTCDAGDFKLANRVVQVDADIPSGSGQGAWTGPTIAFDNQPGVNQNACMGAAVKLRYTTS